MFDFSLLQIPELSGPQVSRSLHFPGFDVPAPCSQGAGYVPAAPDWAPVSSRPCWAEGPNLHIIPSPETFFQEIHGYAGAI
jgi:hypothetical protein